MAVSYWKLWNLLYAKKIKKMKLIDMTKISSSTLAKMSRDEYVSMDVLIRICQALNCSFNDILEIVPDENNLKGN